WHVGTKEPRVDPDGGGPREGRAAGDVSREACGPSLRSAEEIGRHQAVEPRRQEEAVEPCAAQRRVVRGDVNDGRGWGWTEPGERVRHEASVPRAVGQASRPARACGCPGP